MPHADPETGRAYDREYRRTHRAKANEASQRYRRTTRGILNRTREYSARKRKEHGVEPEN